MGRHKHRLGSQGPLAPPPVVTALYVGKKIVKVFPKFSFSALKKGLTAYDTVYSVTEFIKISFAKFRAVQLI